MSENAIAFNVLSESFSGGVTIQITCATAGADIYYTTDNSTPSASNGTKYTEAFEVTQNTTVKAVAVKDGLLDSEVASASFSVSLPTPVLQKQDGTASDNCKVVISNYTDYAEYSGIKLVYTTDNSEPLETGMTTTGEIALTSNVTVKVKAFCTGYEASATGSLAVSGLKVQTPVIKTASNEEVLTVNYASTEENPKIVTTTKYQITSKSDAESYDYYVTIESEKGKALDDVKLTSTNDPEQSFIIARDNAETPMIQLALPTDGSFTEAVPNSIVVYYSPFEEEYNVATITIRIVPKN